MWCTRVECDCGVHVWSVTVVYIFVEHESFILNLSRVTYVFSPTLHDLNSIIALAYAYTIPTAPW